MQSLPITTNIVSSKPARVKVYLIQHYKVCQWLVAGRGFLWVHQFPPPIKLNARYNWNIVDSGVKHHNPNSLLSFIQCYKECWLNQHYIVYNFVYIINKISDYSIFGHNQLIFIQNVVRFVVHHNYLPNVHNLV